MKRTYRILKHQNEDKYRVDYRDHWYEPRMYIELNVWSSNYILDNSLEKALKAIENHWEWTSPRLAKWDVVKVVVKQA